MLLRLVLIFFSSFFAFSIVPFGSLLISTRSASGSTSRRYIDSFYGFLAITRFEFTNQVFELKILVDSEFIVIPSKFVALVVIASSSFDFQIEFDLPFLSAFLLFFVCQMTRD